MLMSIDEIRETVRFSGDPKDMIQQTDKIKAERKPKAVELEPAKIPPPVKPKNKVLQQNKKNFTAGEAPRSSYYNFCT